MFYIVPEQATLQAERQLVERSPAGAVIRAQAISFGRLAYQVFARTGGAPVRQLNETGKHMLLRKILQDCELSFYARAANMPGFIENLSQTVTEFSQYTITPADLENKAQNADLSAKMTDLAAIFRKYRENVAGRYLITGETLELLTQALDGSDYLRGGHFWVDGFKDFTPGEQGVLGRIIAAAENVTVTLTMDKLPPLDGLRQSDFFYATKRTWQVLCELAESLGVTVRPPLFLGELHRFEGRGLRAMAESFPNPMKSVGAWVDGIEVVAAHDKTTELVQAAEWVRRNVIEEKRWRFRDVAILCGDLTGYEKLARNIFEPYGIPLFVDSKMGVLQHPLTELIRAAVDVVVWDWQYEGVFRLLKTGFSGLGQDEIDVLENYVLRRGIRGWRWRVKWHEHDELRLRVLAMLAPFSDGLKDSLSVTEYARRVYDWLYALDVPGTLTKLLEESDKEQERWHKQIWPRIGDIFEKLTEILGEDRVSVRVFGEILEAGFKSADLGMIPPSLDQVVMGDITRSRYPEIKALWVLGANDGQLPPPIGASSLITEDERAALRKEGLILAPDLPRQMSDSLLALYGALCQPREVLALSYSRVGANGKLLRPSPVLARLKRIFPNLAEKAPSQGEPATPDEETAGEMPPLSPDSIGILYGETFHTAASRLEAFAACPFAYFLNYNLGAKERAIYQVRAMDLGILYHDVLAKATAELSKDGGWHRAGFADLERIVHSHAEAALQAESDHVLRSSARNMYILDRVKRICSVSLWALCEQYRRGTFRTYGIESGAGDIVLPLETRHMVVTGRIDRVDIFGENGYLKIIDYKSGNTRFSLEDVQAGTQLQLLLYMNALLKRKPGAVPGGVFYFNIDDPILPLDESPSEAALEALRLKQFRMNGLVLADKENINAMDKYLLQTGGDSPVIPVSVKKDGGFGVYSSVADAAEFAALCGEVEEKVKGIGTHMVSGVIAPNPGEDSCRYCEFSAVCGVSV